MWVVMRVEKWSNFKQGGPLVPFPIRISVGASIGFLVVYETIEDAKAEYPDGPFTEIREIVEAAAVKGATRRFVRIDGPPTITLSIQQRKEEFNPTSPVIEWPRHE